MLMRAAVLEEFGQPLAVQEVELADPKAGEVLVRLVACGVCHTDLYTASGADPSGYAPAVLGHEGAGVVERVGDGVSSVAPGDRVVTLFSPQCGDCEHCRSPRTNLCLAIREQQNKGYLPDGTTRLSRDGEPIRHFMGTSTFAEYTVMPEIALAKVNPEAPFEHACLFACGLSTGLGAAMFTARVEAGSTCVVFGAGMVGLGAVAGCRLQGAERIIGGDARHRPTLPHHGAARMRLVVRGRQGPRAGAAARPALPRWRHRRRAVRLAPVATRRGQPRVRADGGSGRDSQRDRVLRRALRDELRASPHNGRSETHAGTGVRSFTNPGTASTRSSHAATCPNSRGSAPASAPQCPYP
jgi:hypothetical protein